MLLLTFLVKGLLTQAHCVQRTLAAGLGAALLDAHESVWCQPRALHLWVSLERTVFRSWVLTCPLSCLQRRRIKLLPHQAAREDSAKFVVLTLVSLAAIVGVLLASGVIYCLRHRSHYRLKEKLSGPVGDPGPDATNAYQTLCFPKDGHEVVRFNSDPLPVAPRFLRQIPGARLGCTDLTCWLQQLRLTATCPGQRCRTSLVALGSSPSPLLSHGTPLLGLSSRATASSDLLWKLGTCAFLVVTT
ncbi:hypothetical protein MJT46_006406 [Ovis ammon polii x Ovis aries]|nr:hypothetical protein MJT46_006406 [Ovis ammon polii x Ovis aries]